MAVWQYEPAPGFRSFSWFVHCVGIRCECSLADFTAKWDEAPQEKLLSTIFQFVLRPKQAVIQNAYPFGLIIRLPLRPIWSNEKVGVCSAGWRRSLDFGGGFQGLNVWSISTALPKLPTQLPLISDYVWRWILCCIHDVGVSPLQHLSIAANWQRWTRPRAWPWSNGLSWQNSMGESRALDWGGTGDVQGHSVKGNSTALILLQFQDAILSYGRYHTRTSARRTPSWGRSLGTWLQPFLPPGPPSCVSSTSLILLHFAHFCVLWLMLYRNPWSLLSCWAHSSSFFNKWRVPASVRLRSTATLKFGPRQDRHLVFISSPRLSKCPDCFILTVEPEIVLLRIGKRHWLQI